MTPPTANYRPGDILHFANGCIGCVTNSYRLALVSPQGWVIRDRMRLPAVSDYVKAAAVIKRIPARPVSF